MKLKKWIILAMDEGVMHTCDTKEGAKQWCRSTADDGRKKAGWERTFSGFYSYQSSPRYPGVHITEYYVATREAALCQGFDHAIEAYERESDIE